MYPVNYSTFPSFRQPAPAGDSLWVFAFRLARVWRRIAKRHLPKGPGNPE